MPTSLKFDQSNREFVSVLNERINSYFETNNLSKKANGAMIFKTIFYASLWFSSYFFILLGNFSFETKYIFWCVLGFATAFTAVNIGHDAIHGAYSNKQWINRLLSLFFDLNGASSYMWKAMHNTAHHTYTNISGHDGDLDLLPIIRLSPKQKLRAINQYQHIYTFFFYSFATIFWVFTKDYIKFFKNKVGNYSNRKHNLQTIFKFFLLKAVYYLLLLVVPISVVYSNDILVFVCSYLAMHLIAGLTVALIFALAHLVENTHFPEPNHIGTVENSWAVHQLYTTSNFAKENRSVGFLTGGLNTQVEHHLFPNICSIHYRNLAPIVKKTAHQFNLPYLEHPSFSTALVSHIKFLKKIGSEQNYLPKL